MTPDACMLRHDAAVIQKPAVSCASASPFPSLYQCRHTSVLRFDKLYSFKGDDGRLFLAVPNASLRRKMPCAACKFLPVDLGSFRFNALESGMELPAGEKLFNVQGSENRCCFECQDWFGFQHLLLLIIDRSAFAKAERTPEMLQAQPEAALVAEKSSSFQKGNQTIGLSDIRM